MNAKQALTDNFYSPEVFYVNLLLLLENISMPISEEEKENIKQPSNVSDANLKVGSSEINSFPSFMSLAQYEYEFGN
jgi:hypothetical protein